MEITVQSIGIVHSNVEEPREDGWGNIKAEIHLDSNHFTQESLKGLEDFSHVEVIFQFHQIADNDPVFGSRHPRGNTDFPRWESSRNVARTVPTIWAPPSAKS